MRLRLAVPAPFDVVSGAGVYDRAMVDGLRANGHDVVVVELPGAHPLPDDTAYAAALAGMRDLAPDVTLLIDGACLPSFAESAEVLQACGAAALVHHPTALETGRDEATRRHLRAIERAVLPRLRRVVATSGETAQRLAAEFGVDPDRIRVVEPGTPDAPRSPAPMQAACMLLSVGTLLPRKGHDVLLRALARLPDLDWTLTIVGGARDAAYAAELQALADTLDVAARIRFVGELQPAALEPLWQQAAIFALASHYEGYGMVIAEALRRGMPVAITTGTPLAASLPAEAGVIVAPGDAAALSTALRRLIFDTDLRRVMADAAWAHGRSFPDWPVQVQRLVAALER